MKKPMQCVDITWRCYIIDENKYLSYPTEFFMENLVTSSKNFCVFYEFLIFQWFSSKWSLAWYCVGGFWYLLNILECFRICIPLSYIEAFQSLLSTHHFISAFWGLFQKAFHIKHLLILLVKSYQTEVIFHKLNVNSLDDTFEENLITTWRKKKGLKDFSRIVTWHRG